MAIKIGGTTVVTDARGITNIVSGVVVGVQSAGATIGTGATTINFIGAGNTLQYNASTNTIDISISGGGGGIGQKVTGDNDNLFTWVAAAATVTGNITFDTTNSGNTNSYVLTAVPIVTVANGIGVTVGAGKTLIIDVLQLGDL
jgi:hypothetical protein